MKQLIQLLMVMALCAPACRAAETLKVMTYNLRFAGAEPPNSWPERRPVMKECLLEADPDLIGTQEGVYHQLVDLENDLQKYRWIGLGREGGSKGEFMAVFYKPEVLEPLEYDHYWLSDTPEVIASASWGNTVKRMATWVRFKHKSTGKEFYFVNTHFDHQVQVAREKAAALVAERNKQFKQDLPLIVVGDFNAKAGANKAYDTLVQSGLEDTWHTAKERRGEIVATFNSFRGPTPGDNRIDWILGRGIEALWTSILTCSRGNQLPSDHYPVVAEIRWK